MEQAYRLTVKDLPPGERPRERLASLGAAALSEAELLALLLHTGTAGASALDVARGLLGLGQDPGDAVRSLEYLASAPLEELAALKGVGLAKAARLKAALELGQRLAAARGKRPAIRRPEDAAQLVMDSMRHLDREHFQVLYLDTKHRVLGVEEVSVGHLSASLVHPRELFKGAIRRSAAAVILVHNHPSGDPTPSAEDLDLTARLAEAGRILGIDVLDHIVIGDNQYASFRERGLDPATLAGR
ncbi:MAG: DNA repair protein RadC [Firmicutes bacterium]|nr:DNA repair protein RadC [Bacillota bacterium]